MPAIESLTNAQKLRWAQSAGGFRLAGGTVSAAPFVDIELPADFDMLQLNIMNWTTGGDTFAKDYAPSFAFSTDHGATWINDTGLYLLYQPSSGNHNDTLGMFVWYNESPVYINGVYNIFPGSDVLPAGLVGNTGSGYETGLFTEPMSCSLGGQLDTVTTIRLLAFGDGTTTPTTNIASLSYSLIGFAA